MPDINDILREANAALSRALETEQRNKRLIESIGPAVVSTLKPTLDKLVMVMAEMAQESRLSKEDMKDVISQISVNVPDSMPVVDADIIREAIYDAFAQVKIPTPKVSIPKSAVTVKLPAGQDKGVIKAIKDMRDAISTQLKPFGIPKPEHTFSRPLPVILTDPTGKPYIAGEFGGGGNFTPVSYGKFGNVQVPMAVDADGHLQVDILSGGSSGGTGTDVRLVGTASDFNASVTVSGFSGSIGAVILDPDGNPIDPRDASLSITESLEVKQVSGFTDSVNVVSAVALEVKQVSGFTDSVKVTAFDTSIAAQLLGLDGNVIDPRIVTVPQSLETKQVSGFTDSVNVVGFSSSVNVVGSVASDVADDGEPPVKIGGVARTANPSAVAAGDRVTQGYDKMGRALVRPYQVRDLVATAYATLSNGSETALFTGVTGVFHDLVYVMGSNTSTEAIQVDLRDRTGGGVVMTLEIPAQATNGISLAVPMPQSGADQTWTADMGDFSNTTVYLSAQFIKEV